MFMFPSDMRNPHNKLDNDGKVQSIFGDFLVFMKDFCFHENGYVKAGKQTKVMKSSEKSFF